MRRVHESLLPLKNNKYYIYLCACVGAQERGRVHARECSPAYPACKAYVPYCDVICGLWRHHIFRYYLIKDTIFGGKKIIEHKTVF